MPKRFLKKYMPSEEWVSSHPNLQFLRKYLGDESLWHFNRRSVTGAVFIGIFWGFMPIPFQMVPAALCAIWFRRNLPLSLAGVWITNPVTMIPLFYGTYRVGAWILDHPVAAPSKHAELSIDYLMEWVIPNIEPMLVGSLICGIISASAGTLIINQLWRINVKRRWHHRLKLRMQKDNTNKT